MCLAVFPVFSWYMTSFLPSVIVYTLCLFIVSVFVSVFTVLVSSMLVDSYLALLPVLLLVLLSITTVFGFWIFGCVFCSVSVF